MLTPFNTFHDVSYGLLTQQFSHSSRKMEKLFHVGARRTGIQYIPIVTVSPFGGSRATVSLLGSSACKQNALVHATIPIHHTRIAIPVNTIPQFVVSPNSLVLKFSFAGFLAFDPTLVHTTLSFPNFTPFTPCPHSCAHSIHRLPTYTPHISCTWTLHQTTTSTWKVPWLTCPHQ